MRNLKYILLSLAIAFMATTVSGQWHTGGLKLMEVMDKISRFYVDSADEDNIVESAIVKMLHDLDPHSSYISKDDIKEMSEELNGEFEGIGVSFNILQDTIFIISTIQGGPSERVGILAGDRIIRVEDEIVAGIGISTSGVQKRLKGKKGTKVAVTVFRKNSGDEINFKIVRDKIPMYSLDASYMVDRNTGYIKLSRFSQTTVKEFEKALKELEDEGLENLILDLTGNGGGYLRSAVELADHFLGTGKEIVITEGNKYPRKEHTAKRGGLLENGKLVILIDQYSASASEIVSGAVQDWDRGVIVGRRSFGKGLVQQPMRLSDGSEIRLTIARYYTPTGRLIQKSYDNGYEDYAMDIIKRYNQGELSSADSIMFPDSDKYKTLELGRTVYGGGGIMPDYFVPFDTLALSNYYNQLFRKGIFNQYILKYVDQNRGKLEIDYPKFKTFRKEYEVSDELMKGLIKYAEEEGLEFSQEDWDRSETKLKIVFKAFVARDMWDTDEFYEIYNETDAIFLKSREILTHPKLYKEKLKQSS